VWYSKDARLAYDKIEDARLTEDIKTCGNYTEDARLASDQTEDARSMKEDTNEQQWMQVVEETEERMPNKGHQANELRINGFTGNDNEVGEGEHWTWWLSRGGC
jgi:hypothetical protein